MVRTFALVFGLIYLVVGILGFIPGMVHPAHGAPPLAVEANYGLLLGLFPINVLHNLVHVLITPGPGPGTRRRCSRGSRADPGRSGASHRGLHRALVPGEAMDHS